MTFKVARFTDALCTCIFHYRYMHMLAAAASHPWPG